ncbi:MAG TPA: translocation/assembly module TamB domain-containing protein, partial [Rhodothermales bacterium]
VGGSVAITNSRFFREIDILPIELPGRPAPVPPPPPPGITLDGPLANWNFDVAVTTRDPFLIRGNLANGGAVVDLKLVGKGADPVLDGSVRIVDFVASLPFSRLNVTHGFVYFSPDAPFEPNLDIQGESFLRNYRIRVYIYGSVRDAQTIFTSEPPLPQEEIISLLATGTTTAELTGDSSVVAGRAAALLAQKLWRSVFKRKRDTDEDPDPFMDRFDVDIGGVDPRTGEQEVRASFKMTDHFQLIGGLGFRGNARGEARYLIRFK